MEFESIEHLTKEAYAQFDWMAARPTLFGGSAEESALVVAVARKTFDVALALEVGQLLRFRDINGSDDGTPDQIRRVFQAVPYLMGTLGLLEMELHHAQAGVLPREVATQVLRADTAAIPYEGQLLTTANVTLAFRRTDFKRK